MFLCVAALGRSVCRFKCICVASTYIQTYMHTYLLTYMHTYKHTYIHTYMHACMHTYIHTYAHTCSLLDTLTLVDLGLHSFSNAIKQRSPESGPAHYCCASTAGSARRPHVGSKGLFASRLPNRLSGRSGSQESRDS